MLISRLSIFLVVFAFATTSLGQQRHRTRTTSSSSKKSTSTTSKVASTLLKTTPTTTKTTPTTTKTSPKTVKTTLTTVKTTLTTVKTTPTTTKTTPTTAKTTSSKKISTSVVPSTTTIPKPATVILPLYITPTPSNAWNPLYTALTANPNLKFQVIVNPADGPGSANTYPDSDYLAAIPKLRSHANAIPLCYVHTSWTGRALTDVLTDIQTCYNWNTYTQADIHMSGIFFDEATATYNPTTLAYMTNITSYARTLFGSGKPIVFNPGTIVAAEWYSLADYIIAFEDTYTAYSSAVINSIAPAQRPQSMFLIYGFSGTASVQQTLVDGIVAAGIGGLEITTVAGYVGWSSLWQQFCSVMAIA